MTFLSGYIFRSRRAEANRSRPQDAAFASLWPDLASFVVYGFAGGARPDPAVPERLEPADVKTGGDDD